MKLKLTDFKYYDYKPDEFVAEDAAGMTHYITANSIYKACKDEEQWKRLGLDCNKRGYGFVGKTIEFSRLIPLLESAEDANVVEAEATIIVNSSNLNLNDFISSIHTNNPLLSFDEIRNRLRVVVQFY